MSYVIRLPRFIKSKKGFAISYKMIMWIPRIFYTIVVIAVASFFITAFIVTKTNVSAQESIILANVPHYSPDGISVVDKTTGRVYPGIVDSGKISDNKIATAQLEQLFQHDKPLIVGKFVKKQTTDDYFRPPQLAEITGYTDETRYLRWQPIAQAGAYGEGSTAPYPEVRYVAVSDGSGAVMETVFIASN